MSMQELLEDVASLQKSMTLDAQAEAQRAEQAQADEAAAATAAAAAPAAAAAGTEGDEAAAAAAAVATAESEAAAAAAAADESLELPEGLAKSFSLELEDGTSLEAIDGTELIKSFTARLDETGTTVTAVEQAVTGLAGIVKAQAQMMKSMSAQIERLGNEGRGRKASISMPAATPAAPLAKSQAAGTKPDETVMAKCLAAQRNGRLTGMQVSRANIAIENGYELPGDILAGLAE